MAPALPVYSRDEIEQMFPKIKNREEIPKNCEIFKLIQNQCTYDGNKVICLPFKRVFLRCLEKKGKEVIGYKLKPRNNNNNNNDNDNDNKIYRDIEITQRQDNNYKISKDIQEFLKADSILKLKMREYYDKHKE